MTIPEGWKLVPVIPTDEMIVAFAEAWYSKHQTVDDPDMLDAYSAMLAAAPVSPQADEEPVTACNLRFKTWVPQSSGGSMLADAVPAEHFDNDLSRLRTENEELRKALNRIARPHDCGCAPCTGDCTSKLSLEITIDEIRESARAALATASPATINQQGEGE